MKPTQTALSALTVALALFATPRRLAAQAPPADPEVLAAALNRFAVDLHTALPAADAALCSPFSVATVLLELLPGARGTTADDLATVLHLPAELRGDRLHRAVKGLFDGLHTPTTKSKEHIDFTITNDLWAQRGARIEPAFSRVLRDYFTAGTTELDFAKDCERARRTINEHIARATNQRIPELLQQGVLLPETTFVATNAVWLRGAWLHEFHRPTETQPFHVTNDRAVAASMMTLTKELRYAESAAWQAVTLPLRGGDIVFDIVVPSATGTLAQATAAALDGATWQQATPTSVQLIMPAFRTRTAPDLTAALRQLGLRDAFTGSRADFSGIAKAPPIFVDRIVHGAWIAVDEHGVEAAAATAAVLKAWSAEVGTPKTVHADHPFAFVLRDTRTGLVLFVGQVTDPVHDA